MYTYDLITLLKYQNRSLIKTDIKIGVFRLCPPISYTTPLLLLVLLYCKSICKTTVRAFGRCKHYAPNKLGTQLEKIQTSYPQSNTSCKKLESSNCSSRASVILPFNLQVLNCKFASTVVSTVVHLQSCNCMPVSRYTFSFIPLIVVVEFENTTQSNNTKRPVNSGPTPFYP